MAMLTADLEAFLAGLEGPLSLEERKGYTDDAVIGGLGPFMLRRTSDVAGELAQPQLRSQLRELGALFRGYEAADASRRAATLARARQLMQRLRQGGPSASSEDARAAPQRERRRAGPSLDDPVTVVSGVSEKRAEQLANLGIRTVKDLLQHYPVRHEDRREIAPIADLSHGQQAAILAEVIGPGETERRRSLSITKVEVRDETGHAYLTWFGQDFRATQFAAGARVFAAGTVKFYGMAPHLQTPEVELVGRRDTVNVGRIVPIYGLTKGLYMPQLRRIIHAALRTYAPLVPEMLPREIRERHSLCDAQFAIMNIHFPETPEAQEAAKRRVAFEELFILQVQLARLRREAKGTVGGVVLEVRPEFLDAFKARLPFQLTRAQERAIRQIGADLASPEPANRLLHGDVGSGKTVVAAWALLVAARNECQGAFMAPTEILAEQHHRVLRQLLEPLGVEVGLLIGGVTRGRAELLRRIADGGLPIVVGTHALIQEGVEFAHLGLAIIDEQHRFGVMQRAALREKGYNPNVLVMTATPIPRTLALTVYGDFDISVLDEMPAGRQPVVTQVLTMRQRPKAYEFVRQEVREGKQAFIVCPLVDESDKLEARAATELAKRLQRDIMPELRIGLIHGRMSVAEKDAVMEAFREGRLDVLCSTTVIEVGVDVPNATLMLVENAERFGLAQLHQLRGRVGRGAH
jgi:ATP-dependent DNA helicase RecG